MSFYHKLENSWYNFLDKVEKKVPVYKVIDPIDRVFPSLILFIIVLVLIFGVGFYYFFVLNFSLYTNVIFEINSEDGSALSGVVFDYEYEDKGELVNGKVTSNDKGILLIENVPVGTELFLSTKSFYLGTRNFGAFSDSFLIELNMEEEVFLDFSSDGVVENITIYLKSSAGNRISGKDARIILSCENSAVVPSPNIVYDTDKDGIINIVKPINCGNFFGTVEVSGFQSTQKLISDSSYNFLLNEEIVPSSSLKILIRDSEGASVPLTDFRVALSDEFGFITSKLSASSQVIFDDLELKNYFISVSDDSGEYGIVSDSVYLNSESQKIITINVAKTVKAYIKIEVKDKDSNAKVRNAVVQLYDSSDNLLSTKSNGSNGDIVEFSITNFGNYKVVVKKNGEINEGYFADVFELGLVDKNISRIVKITKITAFNSGRVKVFVKDEDNLPVENAKVFLRREDESIIPLSSVSDFVLSDVNGVAEFILGNNINEKIYAFATKYSSFGNSELSNVLLRDVLVLNVDLVIGNGSIEVNLFDEDNFVIEDGFVEFFDISGDSVSGKLPVVGGSLIYQTKADKTIFAKVSHEDKISFFTVPQRVWNGRTIVYDVVLKNFYSEEPRLEFEGAFFDGSQVFSLLPGNIYTAKFLLLVPSNKFKEFGLHFRTGSDFDMVNDFLVVRDISAGFLNNISKGKTFNPPNNYSFDSENFTDGEAKWVNGLIFNPEQGIYEFEVEFKIKNNFSFDESLDLFYRAWFVRNNNEVIRIPLDSVLGSSRSNSAKQELYAETEMISFSSLDSECDEEFCFSSEWVFDNSEGLFIYSPYVFDVFGDYNFHFSILNNSETNYLTNNEEIELFVDFFEDENLKNPIRISNYLIKDAEGVISSSNQSVFDIKNFETGNFVKNTKIEGNLLLQGLKEGQHLMRIRLIGKGIELFSKEIIFSVNSENLLVIETDPSEIPAYLPTELAVKISDDEKFVMDEVLVRVSKLSPSKVRNVISEELSNPFGYAFFDLPASSPGSKFIIEAEKQGYASSEFVLLVDENVVSFNPEELVVSLIANTKNEALVDLELINDIGMSLVIDSVEFTGEFKGLLDSSTMSAFINQYSGFNLEALKSTNLNVKFKLNNAILNQIDTKQDLEGNLVFNLRSENFNLDYDIIVPLKISVLPSGNIDVDSCLSLTKKEWVSSIQGGQSIFRTQLQNNCKSEGTLISLDSISAMLEWNSDLVGSIEVSAVNPANNNSYSSILRQGTLSKIFSNLGKEEVLNLVFTFTPSVVDNGIVASFDIDFSGEFASKEIESESINSEITLINLKECITFGGASTQINYSSSSDSSSSDSSSNFSSDSQNSSSNVGNNSNLDSSILFVPYEGSGSFVIDSSACGNVDLEFFLCKDDGTCAGGVEGSINVSEKNFSLNSGSKTITVTKGSLPGSYGIPIFVRMRNSGFIYVGEQVVNVEADPMLYFELDKTNFSLIGKDSEDSAILKNKIVDEMVYVKADNCAWGEVSEKFDKDSALTFGMAGAAGGAYIGAKAGTVFGIPGMIVGAVVGGAVGAIGGGLLGAEDCSEDFAIRPLPDYVIYLAGTSIKQGKEFVDISSDALPLSLVGVDNISANWDFGNSSLIGGKETVGIKLVNSGVENENPTYGILEVKAVEHIHGNLAHSNSAFVESDSVANPNYFDVECGKGDFYAYNINEDSSCFPLQDKEYSQKYHVRFITKQGGKQLPVLNLDGQNCFAGSLIGSTGKSALPNIALEWDWEDIDSDFCNADDGVFCDSTQFSISLVKKLKAFKEFLAVNGNNFSCPTNPGNSDFISSLNQSNDNYSSGEIFIKNLSHSVSGDAVSFNVIVGNNVEDDVDGVVKIDVESLETGFSGSCQISFNAVESGKEKTGSCVVDGLPLNSGFTAVAGFISASHVPSKPVGVSFAGRQSGSGCWLESSTALKGDFSTLEYFVNKDLPYFGQFVNHDVSFSSSISSIEDLRNVLHFRAYLTKDSFNSDFVEDFALQYSKLGELEEFASYFNNGDISFSRKFLNNAELPEPGLYDVEVSIDFDEDWIFFRDGEPTAKINVKFYLISSNMVDSPFYYLPFDGLVGRNSSNGRVGYGADYKNNHDLIKISDSSFTIIDTAELSSDNGLVSVSTSVNQDPSLINSSPSSRGKLLNLNYDNENLELVFSPNYATPVLMKIESEERLDSLSVGYQFEKNSTPLSLGSNLTLWTGAGRCLDFSGVAVQEVFNNYADLSFEDNSGLLSSSSYGLNWVSVDDAGVVYLKSIFFTPISEANFALRSLSEEVSFANINEDFSESVTLTGINPSNNSNVNSNNNLSSIEDIFSLVESNLVCVSSSASNVSFWWNPAELYNIKGNNFSVKEFEEALVAGSTCIG